MKFFAALIAKLTGTADQPKTLDQARATFGEAKAALDKIAALFTSAALDLDAMLAKGESALKDFIAELNGKVTTAEAALTEANGKVTAAEAKTTEAEGKVTALNSQLSALSSLFASIGFKPAELKDKDGKAVAAGAPEYTAAFQAAFNAHIANGVTQKMAELGVKADKLPAAATADSASTLEEIRAQLATCTDPVLAGKLAQRADALRNPSAKAANN